MVASPEPSIEALIKAVVTLLSKPREVAITKGTTIIPPKAANIC